MQEFLFSMVTGGRDWTNGLRFIERTALFEGTRRVKELVLFLSKASIEGTLSR